MAKFLYALLLFYLCGCAGTSHRAPAPGDAEVIPITAQWLAGQRRERNVDDAASAVSALSRPAALPVPVPIQVPVPVPVPGSVRIPAPATAAGTDSAYRLGVGDVLAVTVWDHPELTGAGLPSRSDNLDGQTGPPPATFVIDQQGQLHFPFAGAVPLAGLTREAARDRLAQRLARYFRAPRVTVTVMAYRSQRVYVDGQVRTPGPQPINDIPMTVLEALNRAGGLLPTADQSRISVERAGRRYRIDLAAMMGGGLPLPPAPADSVSTGRGHPAAVLLADGDVVRAPPRDESKVFVGGEVLSPRALTMHDGRLTLGEALGEAGGLNPQSADAGQVYVVRRARHGDDVAAADAAADTVHGAGVPGRSLVYRLDARSASALALAEQFELQPRDVVYVAASTLTNWHRAISQLFPGELSSAVGVTTRP
ncbi:polysaccharide export outer membrane protein [Duganella sp. 3397]|uniref:polysaccharide biosynthesis/export family protein n=1 Tax=Duganella sp. 3397 TaxID=2817732 RepID=UPI0028573DD4|nr:polysaccharide biosynthesis/export family protein [Duganella sp. 3397]MDR7051292.1 polysaccharide export outer membrane protein [Duganella sp. 3397]